MAKVNMKEEDLEFLKWLHKRMINIYKEKENIDFVKKLEDIIERCEKDMRK